MSKQNLNYAIGYGIFGIIISYISINQILSPMMLMAISFTMGLAIFFGICILVAKSIKKENNGYASFGSLIKAYAMIFGISTLISISFSIVYVSILSEDSKEVLAQKTLDSSMEMLENLGMVDDDMMEQMEETMEEASYKAFKPSTYFFSGIVTFLGSILFSLIPAAIMKKEPPFDADILDS